MGQYTSQRERFRRWLNWHNLFLPLIFYSVVAIVITWPLVAHLSTNLAGPEYSDSMEYARLGWWAQYALQHGLNPFYQSLFGYPGGFFSAQQWSQPLIYWPIALIAFVTGSTAAFNIWLLLEVILSGLTAYWLCCEVIQNPVNDNNRSEVRTIAALFGGMIFMAFPAVQAHLVAGHINPLANYALPVVVLCLYRIVEGRGTLRIAVIGALALLILALGNFTFPVFTILPIVLFGGGYLVLFRRKSWRWRSMLVQFVVMFVLGGVLMLPFYLPLLAEAVSPTPPAYLEEGGWVTYSTEPLAFIAPSPFTTWGKQAAPSYSLIILGENAGEVTAYLGVVAVLIAALGVWRRRSSAMLWLVIALGCMLFSLGPLLKWENQPVTYTIGDFQSNIVLPWALFQNLPFINLTRTPGRFNITTGLALGVLAALGLDVLLAHVAGRGRQIALTGIVVVLTLADYQSYFPFPSTPTDVPAYFATLPQRQDIRAVFDVPWDDYLAQKKALLEQIVHQKPLIAGYVSRRTPVDPARLALMSNVVMDGSFLEDSGQPPNADAVRSLLKDNGVDVLVYHWQPNAHDQQLKWATQMFNQPVYADDWTGIFEIPAPSQHVDSSVYTFSTAGWWQRSGEESRWLEGNADLYIDAPTEQDRHWSLALAPLLQTRRLQLAVDGQIVQSWNINLPSQTLDFWLKLEPGFHTLHFVAPDPCIPVQVAPMCLRYDAASQPPQSCILKDNEQNQCVSMALDTLSVQDAGSMALQSREVALHDGTATLDFQGFRAPTQANTGDSLTIETDWLAPQKLPGDYHMFVPLLDQSGKAVAQVDVVPGGGTFPTADWSASQHWTETVTLKLPKDLAPGTYSLYAGWYRYPEIKRMTVDGGTLHAADGLVYLRDLTVH